MKTQTKRVPTSKKVKLPQRRRLFVPQPRPLGNPTLTVLHPDPTNPSSIAQWEWNNQGQIVIYVVFSAPVNQASVIPQQNVILRTRKKPDAPIFIQWVSDTSMLITSQDSWENLLVPNPDDLFALTLIGTDITIPGAIPGTHYTRFGITDQFGNLLDGNYDGVPGGNYEAFFVLIG